MIQQRALRLLTDPRPKGPNLPSSLPCKKIRQKVVGTMHRAICRVVGRTCRKWRENECPVVGGEEVRKGRGEKKEEFIPDSKYTVSDAIGWTAGLVLAYEFSHGKRRTLAIDERPRHHILSHFQTRSVRGEETLENATKCPFPWPTKAVTQPIISRSSVFEVNSSYKETISPQNSIDLTPFIKDDALRHEPTFENLGTQSEEEDEVVHFAKDKRRRQTRAQEAERRPSLTSSSTPIVTKLVDPSDEEEDFGKLSLSEKLAGDLLSVLGAFKFLNNQAKGAGPKRALSIIDKGMTNISPEEPPLSALDLMEAGVDLGSARALYNIGVAYDRMNDNTLARDYYSRAADLGHPLATYNCAVFLLKDGRILDGLTMMQDAADNGVPEAQKIMSVTRAK